MNQKIIHLPDEASTIALAEKLSVCLTVPLVLTLRGEIGAGKTCFIRALLRATGLTGSIKSPTFTLVESYSRPGLQIHHFDLYRIQDEEELDYIGFRDYFTEHSLCCIEWPEKAPNHLEAVDINGTLSMNGDGRIMTFDALTIRGKTVLTCLVGTQ